MKRLVSPLLLVLVAVVLVACGGNEPRPTPTEPTGTWGESNWNEVRWGE